MESIREQYRKEEAENMKMLSYVYGSHLPFRLALERNLVMDEPNSYFPRSNLALEILTGRDLTIRFPEYIDESPSLNNELSRLSLN